MSAAERLEKMGLALPKPSAPAANYVPVVRTGRQLYVSGQISSGANGVVKGHLGGDMDVAAGQAAARLCALNILGQIVHTAGVPLDEISRFLKVTVLVASTADFSEQHLVANGASDLFVEVLGDAGRHARAAFGVASLPLGAAVEVEAIVEAAS